MGRLIRHDLKLNIQLSEVPYDPKLDEKILFVLTQERLQILLDQTDKTMVRGKRKKTDADDKISCIPEPELTDKAFRRNWARLIQKIYEVNPLITLQRPIFKNRTRAVRLPMPKILYFQAI